MGLFDQITPPTWQGSTTAPTTQKQTLNWNPYQVKSAKPTQLNWNPMQVQPGQPLSPTWNPMQIQPGQAPSLNWNPYDPKAVQSTYQFGQATPYSGAEQGAISALSNIIQYGGYSPEQKQTMYRGMMAPAEQQAEEARRRAEADAYSRGLGQSGVLSRSYGDIDKQLVASGQQAMGQIEAQGASQFLPAIQTIQQGQQNLQQMMAGQAEAEAGRGMTREQLATQLNMTEGELQMQLSKTGVERDIALQEMATRLNITQGELETRLQEAEVSRDVSLQGIAAQLNMTEGELQTQIQQLNAEMGLAHQQLAAQLNMHEGDLQVAMNQINATLEMSDADRQVELQRIMNQFNLDAAQLEMVQNEAKKDRWSSFFSNLLGGAATVGGAALGAK